MCTGIMLRNADGTVVHGRTGEFGYFLDTDAVVVPRGHTVTGETPDGPGMRFTTKYAAVGLICFDKMGFLDGLNERGLGIGAFYFPSYAEYATITDENIGKALSPSQFPDWVLGRFATIDELRAAIDNEEVVIAPTPVDGFGEKAPPFHYVVYDRDGSSIVIEPVGGQLVVHDNLLGVMTNSPTFDWHITNLRNFIALDPMNVPPITVSGETVGQLGQGGGMLGLPGDFTPPSRFVRAAVFSATAVPSPDAPTGIEQVFHILNNFDIPVGVTREMHDGTVYNEYTSVTTARDPQNLRFYYKTYEDQTLRMVDLKRFDPDATGVVKLKTNTDQPIVDMSEFLT